ncbi:transporter [Dawidia soli]|uniref:Transporter n=1 Tax=Dawidia soli TaxID=2782352 RepID=A0AAP2GHS7_9BACT|nr:transporter [Dawidia soli]MBT1687501.1 transporter [Dawidia soli]
MKKIYLILIGLLPALSFAQNFTDGLMMGSKKFCTGFIYTHDQWTDYWQGEKKRDNGNIGHVTTQSVAWMGTYGIINKVNVIAMVPYIKTKASAGTLSGLEGIQDLTVGVKYNFFGHKTDKNAFNTFAVFNVSTPLSDYTPDFFPLSIGTQTTNLQYRLTAHFKVQQGWFVNGSGGYTWRSNTTLDRPAYFDGNEQYNTDEVKMPNVFDVFVSAGYHKGALQAELNYIQQNTLGGADIRKQDMPFVSNRMNYIKAGVLVMYYLPKPQGLAVRGAVNRTLTGRNVGESTAFLAGAMYTLDFNKKNP